MAWQLRSPRICAGAPMQPVSQRLRPLCQEAMLAPASAVTWPERDCLTPPDDMPVDSKALLTAKAPTTKAHWRSPPMTEMNESGSQWVPGQAMARADK